MSMILSTERQYEELTFDNGAWNYDSANDVYWQIGVVYCTNPAAAEYESLGIYVPGAYMDGTANGDGTYTCVINTEGTVGGYGAGTAPIVMPVNTPGYSAQSAPTSYNYNTVSSYIEAGFVYVLAGCRGRDNGYDSEGNLIYSGGAPWGVTDLKAAVRYLRYNGEALPGSKERIFTFGHSGGGAQSSLMGATGDSPLYSAYLESIGAAMSDEDGGSISDAISGAACWCPITSLDLANEAYEWMMGQFASTGTRAEGTWTAEFSKDLSQAFVEYTNSVGLVDGNGANLTLSESGDGIFLAGSYYDYLLSEIERSLNNFLSDTEFPYTSGGQPGPGGGESVTYETVQEYIDSLNSDEIWVIYDAAANTATVTSVEAFVIHCKNASKNVGAFDDLNRGQAENYLFGDDENDALHFDWIMAGFLEENRERYAAYSNWNEAYVEAYQEYRTSTDALGSGSLLRQAMYNPMYYLSNYYEGFGTSSVAPYWRIHSGIEQGDTSLTVEMNLALALRNYSVVENVEFEAVWAQGHTMAERTGNSTDNFINWINGLFA